MPPRGGPARTCRDGSEAAADRLPWRRFAAGRSRVPANPASTRLHDHAKERFRFVPPLDNFAALALHPLWQARGAVDLDSCKIRRQSGNSCGARSHSFRGKSQRTLKLRKGLRLAVDEVIHHDDVVPAIVIGPRRNVASVDPHLGDQRIAEHDSEERQTPIALRGRDEAPQQ